MNDGPEWIIALMGYGGNEFGMTLFYSADDWKWLMKNSQNPSEEFSRKFIERGQHSLSFETPEHVRINDVLLAFSEGWDLPDKVFDTHAFPTPRTRLRYRQSFVSTVMLIKSLL